jgi:Domain of unknown function (DUF4189)/Caspase domain
MSNLRLMAWIVSVLATLFGGSGVAHAFGALAIDGYRDPHCGFSYNYANVVDARARAIKECGANCTVVVTFQNTCAAFAADQSQANGATGWGHAPTKEEAQSIALNFFSKYGGKSCLVRVWACESLIARDATAKAEREGSPPAEGTVVAAPAPAPPVMATAPTNVEPAPTPMAPPSSASVDGARRIALVIGNDAYENLDHLQKAVNDARAVSAALTQLGFDVIRVENAPRRTMTQKIVEFASKIGRGDTAFFFIRATASRSVASTTCLQWTRRGQMKGKRP